MVDKRQKVIENENLTSFIAKGRFELHVKRLALKDLPRRALRLPPYAKNVKQIIKITIIYLTLCVQKPSHRGPNYRKIDNK